MSRTSKRSDAASNRKDSSPSRTVTHADLLRQTLEWFSKGDSFANLRLHGNVSWTVTQLVVLAVMWVWSDKKQLTTAFVEARGLATVIFQSVAVSSYQGLLGALRRYSEALLPQLWSHLQQLMKRSAGEHWRIGRWLPLAVDGSRITTPQTVSNEQAFSAKTYGKSRKAKARTKWKNKKRRSKKVPAAVKPQMWLTLVWHMGLKMPWCWKSGPSTSSERGHLLDLLLTLVFPVDTLFCGDAGFVGHDFWKAILDHGHNFLMRVGGNVRLLRELGDARARNGIVYLWPRKIMDKKLPPLALRLIEFQGARGKVYLVTNILSERDLSDRQAQKLYRLRWGVELQFRAFKQTFGRRVLRSRTAENARVELEWSLVGLWMIQLYAVKEQIRIDSPPEQSSVALAVNIVQEIMRDPYCPISDPDELRKRLGAATKDKYQRTKSKRGRYRPPSKDKPSATKPIITKATREQKTNFRNLGIAM